MEYLLGIALLALFGIIALGVEWFTDKYLVKRNKEVSPLTNESWEEAHKIAKRGQQ